MLSVPYLVIILYSNKRWERWSFSDSFSESEEL